MQAVNLAFVIAAATDERHDDPFALAVRGAVEVGVVVPSILRTRLAAAGFTVTEDRAALAEYGITGSETGCMKLIAEVIKGAREELKTVRLGSSEYEGEMAEYGTPTYWQPSASMAWSRSLSDRISTGRSGDRPRSISQAA